MTREQAKTLLPVIQAYSEGKQVEFRTGDDLSFGPWTPALNPSFNPCYEWRVKPHPREFLIEAPRVTTLEYDRPDAVWVAENTTLGAECIRRMQRGNGRPLIKVREVLD